MSEIWPKPFFYASTSMIGFYTQKWDSLYPSLNEAGKFWLDLAKFFNGHNCFISRNGNWKSPWQFEVVPGFEMPKINPSFSKSFSEITDKRALDIRELVRKSDQKIALYYSGGIDSTICLTALLRNLNVEELNNIHVCLSAESIHENPFFFEKFIYNKLKIIDSSTNQYSDILAKGFMAITADQGDCLFGTEAAVQLYRMLKSLCGQLSTISRNKIENLLKNHSASEIAYSEFADIIRLYFACDRNPAFGSTLYDLIVKNIQTSTVHIYSLHDFFWWIIFNLKYMHCATRSVISYSGDQDQEQALQHGIINWFNHPEYRLWSLVNNNNGEKIRGTSPTAYKWAGRQYIYSFDKNDWYLHHKMKLASLGSIFSRSAKKIDRISLFGMSNNYKILRLTDPEVIEKVSLSLHRFSF